ncbi:MAG: PAS domain S-box protein [Flavobacteriales bacterium]|nr:PAS domain S-box protein [Flavobacteriales bacterium]
MKTDLPDDLHRLVFDSVAEGVLITDSEGTIVKANPRLHQMLGYTTGQLDGLKLETLIPKRFQHGHVDKRNGYVKNPQQRPMGQGMQLWAMRADESEFPVEVSLNHFKRDGKMYVLALMTDITLRQEAQDQIVKLNLELEQGVKKRTAELDKVVKALQESQQLYSLIAQNFPSGLINVLDLNYNYVFVEGQDLTKYRLNRDSLIGTSYVDRLSETNKNIITKELSRVCSGMSSAFEMAHDGNSYLMNAVPLYSADGAVNQILLVENNITEQKQAERDMVSALTKERELNELKSRFVSMASHEFRTPLATILSSVALISRYGHNNNHEKADKHLERVRNSVQNLTSILNDFLSLEKLEKGIVDCDIKEFNLREVAESVKEDIGGMTKKHQQIDYRFSGKESVILDPQMMRNIMLNILSNAVKYSPEDSTITFQIEVTDHQIQLTISDQGMGIPKADQRHLFQRFFRAKNATSIQGTGLGLNIVKRYAEMMKGSVEFTSQEGKGTTFILKFPTSISTGKKP